MCGIAGAIGLEGQSVGDSERLAVKAMLSAMSHRGPDGVGFYSSDNVYFGHARLSIIDLAGGQQPLYDASGDVALIVNGEIYDYASLRAKLASDYKFQTQSDSEILLALYAANGRSFANDVNGMFAYALHDSRTRSVHLGVDPMGIKPLYFANLKQQFIFASELTALVVGLRSLGEDVRPDLRSISAYLRLGWIPLPETGICGVQRLEPGTTFVIAPSSPIGKSSIQTSLCASDQSATGSVRSCVSEAIERQMIADVPVGIFLSGGIDSSLITALASKYNPKISTFTVRFTGSGEAARVNEADIAARVADHVGSAHHEVSIGAEELFALLDDALIAQDELISDPAVLPLLALSRFARERVKVCLSGDGGDEIFGGYLRHIYFRSRATFNRFPRVLRRSVRAVFAAYTPTGRSAAANVSRRAIALAKLLTSGAYLDGPFSGVVLPAVANVTAERLIPVPKDVAALFQTERMGPLAAHMLTKTDRISMAASLEVRVPLLDLEVIRYGNALPFGQKVSGRKGKVVLRQLAESLLPADITRMPKRGFRVPVNDWFRDSKANELEDRLHTPHPVVEELFGRQMISHFLDDHKVGAANYGGMLWSLLVLQNWCQRMFRADGLG